MSLPTGSYPPICGNKEHVTQDLLTLSALRADNVRTSSIWFFSMILRASARTANICAAWVLFLKTILWDLSKKMHGKHLKKVHNTKGGQLLHVLELMHVRAITNYWFLSSWACMWLYKSNAF